MDEFLEITFFIKGSYKTGYSLNNKRIYVQAFTCKHRGNVIGAYGVTFHKRANFIYTTTSSCSGHFIRKKKWHGLLTSIDPALCRVIKQEFINDYNSMTKTKIAEHKMESIKKMKRRADYEAVMSLWEINNNKLYNPQGTEKSNALMSDPEKPDCLLCDQADEEPGSRAKREEKEIMEKMGEVDDSLETYSS